MKVSIALCTYNGRTFLPQQLNSFLEQTRLPDELVVCDDGSADGTLELLQSFAQTAPFPVRIKVNTPNLGAVNNFAQALSLCTGELIFLSDQDDCWLPQKIQAYLDYFATHPTCLLLFTDAALIDAQGQTLPESLWASLGFTPAIQQEWHQPSSAVRHLVNGRNRVTGATVALRAPLIRLALPFPADLRAHGWWHDGWLALVAALGNGLHLLPTVHTQYRLHQAQQVGVGAGLASPPRQHYLDRTRFHLNSILAVPRWLQHLPPSAGNNLSLKIYLYAARIYWYLKIVSRTLSQLVPARAAVDSAKTLKQP